MTKSLLFASMIAAAAVAIPFSAASAETVKLSATLSGANETGGGDADGAGSFTAEIDADAGDFCYMLSVANVASATAAHVHTGEAGANGGPVTAVNITGAGNDECVAVEPDTLKPIVANPGGFYINVHNAEFPGGAVRGQLTKQ